MTSRRIWIQTFSVLSIAMFLGCSSGDTREYGKVSGMVTMGGKPAPKGVIINLMDFSSGAATSGITQDDGTYSIPRAIVGEYQVSFSMEGQSSSGNSSIDPDEAMKQIEAGTYVEPNASNTIPEKFRSPSTSGLKANVTLGDNLVDFNI